MDNEVENKYTSTEVENEMLKVTSWKTVRDIADCTHTPSWHAIMDEKQWILTTESKLLSFWGGWVTVTEELTRNILVCIRCHGLIPTSLSLLGQVK